MLSEYFRQAGFSGPYAGGNHLYYGARQQEGNDPKPTSGEH
jgi:hypothetical protein